MRFLHADTTALKKFPLIQATHIFFKSYGNNFSFDGFLLSHVNSDGMNLSSNKFWQLKLGAISCKTICCRACLQINLKISPFVSAPIEKWLGFNSMQSLGVNSKHLGYATKTKRINTGHVNATVEELSLILPIRANNTSLLLCSGYYGDDKKRSCINFVEIRNGGIH